MTNVFVLISKLMTNSNKKTTSANSKLKTNWNLGLLYKNDSDPQIQKDLDEVKSKSYKFINKWKDRKDYLTNSSALLESLVEYDNWNRKYSTDGYVGYYFGLKKYLDQSNPEIKARLNKITEFAIKIQNDIHFYEINLSKIPSNKQKDFLADNNLAKYHYFLKCLFDAGKHTLTQQEERILNLKDQTSSSNWVSMVAEFISTEERSVIDEDGNKTKKTLPELLELINSTKKPVRDESAKAINSILKKHEKVAEHEMNSILHDKKVNDELRNYTRPDEARLKSDDISTDTIDSLVESVSKNFDITHDFYQLKAKLFNQEKLEYHERNVPYGEFKKEYSFDENVEIIYEVFKDIDKEFNDIFDMYIKNGQVDVYPAKGKYGGAFSIKHLPDKPGYILLNHTGTLDNITTLAHEFGHAIHSELSSRNEVSFYTGHSLACAEVASTFLEDFVYSKISQNLSDQEKLILNMNKLNDDVSTIFRQIACYSFEKELHTEFRKKGYLKKEDIGEIFIKHMGNYMGDFVIRPKEANNWWVYWSHIRRYFYVYSYASGLLISKSLQSKVKSDKSYIKEVKKFLSAGETDSPENIFKSIGIDITKPDFWQQGISEIRALLDETTELARNLKLIK